MELKGANQDLLLRLMSAASLRAEAIAGNLANQNVPGYKRQVVRFEEQLVEAMQSPGRDVSRVAVEMTEDTETPSRADGNNVVAESEQSAMRENLIRFQLYANILEGNTRLLEAAINGDR